MSPLKTKIELKEIVDQIARPDAPVGMDAVHVHAMILDYLRRIEQRLSRLENEVEDVKRR